MKGIKDLKTGRYTKNIPTMKECSFCSKSFSPRHEIQKFCKRECMGMASRKGKERDCVWCKTKFSSKSLITRFCSQKCYGKSGVGAKRGEENHLWKGGITPINNLIRCSGKYKNMVKDVLARDDYTCRSCDIRGNKLHVDHIIPFSAIMEKIRFEYGEDNVLEEAMGNPLLWDLSNLRTLCIGCHKKTDTYLNYNAKKYAI